MRRVAMLMKVAVFLKPHAARLACYGKPFIAAVIEHAAHYRLEVARQRGT